jgi:hypothetical protein
MRFIDKPLSSSIDDILKSSTQSTHRSFPIINKQSYSCGRLENCSDQRLSSSHCHLSIIQLDSIYPNFIHYKYEQFFVGIRCSITKT